MGNVNSDQKSKGETCSKGRRIPFAARQIPKYLKPTKTKERKRAPSTSSRSKSSSKEKAVQFADLNDEKYNDEESRLPNVLMTGASLDHSYDAEHSANFKWIRGRRFTDTEVSCCLSPLTGQIPYDLLTPKQGVGYLFPVDKPEQDRQRMQAYVLKWAFGRYNKKKEYRIHKIIYFMH
jgi:hypothetical protein